MAPLADPVDLGLFLQAEVDEDTADLLLAVASGLIRAHVGWSISEESGVTHVTQGDGGNLIWLPTKRLTGVTSVEVDGEPLAGDAYRWTSTGRLRRVAGRWPCLEQSVEVVFTHGHDPVPDDVRGVCLALAGRLHSNPEGLRSWSVDGLMETNATGAETGLVLTEIEKRALDPYLLVRAG